MGGRGGGGRGRWEGREGGREGEGLDKPYIYLSTLGQGAGQRRNKSVPRFHSSPISENTVSVSLWHVIPCHSTPSSTTTRLVCYITHLNVANPLVGLCIDKQYSFDYLQLKEYYTKRLSVA